MACCSCEDVAVPQPSLNSQQFDGLGCKVKPVRFSAQCDSQYLKVDSSHSQPCPLVIPSRKTMKTLLAAAALTLALTTGLQASTITSAGTLVNLTPAGFGSGTDNADLDAQGAGTGGFVLFNSVPEGTNVAGTPWNQSIVSNLPPMSAASTAVPRPVREAGPTMTTSRSVAPFTTPVGSSIPRKRCRGPLAHLPIERTSPACHPRWPHR